MYYFKYFFYDIKINIWFFNLVEEGMDKELSHDLLSSFTISWQEILILEYLPLYK